MVSSCRAVSNHILNSSFLLFARFSSYFFLFSHSSVFDYPSFSFLPSGGVGDFEKERKMRNNSWISLQGQEMLGGVCGEATMWAKTRSPRWTHWVASSSRTPHEFLFSWKVTGILEWLRVDFCCAWIRRCLEVCAFPKKDKSFWIRLTKHPCQHILFHPSTLSQSSENLSPF